MPSSILLSIFAIILSTILLTDAFNSMAELNASYCNITSTQVGNLKSGQVVELTPLKLGFKQSSGFIISAVAAALPNELKTYTTIPTNQVCIYNTHADITSYLNLVFLPKEFGSNEAQQHMAPQQQLPTDFPINKPAAMTSRLWSDLNAPGSWIYEYTSPTSPLRAVDLPSSSRPTALYQLNYCRTYNSLQDPSLECPDATKDDEAKDKSLTGNAIGLALGSLALGLICIAIFFWQYKRYELQADIKQQENIKKMKKLKAQKDTLQTPEQAAYAYELDNQQGRLPERSKSKDLIPLEYPR